MKDLSKEERLIRDSHLVVKRSAFEWLVRVVDFYRPVMIDIGTNVLRLN